MAYTVITLYICDNCSKEQRVEGTAIPEGWTGERPMMPGESNGFAVNWLGTPRTHYCDDCNKASLEAGRAALAARRA